MKPCNWNTLIVAGLLLLAGCNKPTQNSRITADPENGGLRLPSGFAALVVAENLGHGRHITVNDNGDIYLALEELNNGHGIAALRDTSGDGKAEQTVYFGDLPGTGLQVHKGYLYFAHDTCVLRYKLVPGELLPDTRPETIISGFTRQYQHAAKSIAFDSLGNLYVNVGAPSNACQTADRTPGSPGMDPCPILDMYGGIWRFKDDVTNQTQEKDGHRYATGLRNCVALDWNTRVDKLYVVPHGRDQLNQFFPQYYDDNDNANLPAEEFFLLEDGDDCGWPYCYYDGQKNQKLLAPEYGGNGDSIGRCSGKKDPILAFPAHYAPNDLLFYSGDQFPEKYRNGAFIAFHGSWNRAPMVQEGFNVAFVPFQGQLPSGDWMIFADGFAGSGPINNPGDAVHRPTGLAVGPDGSLYISDSVHGTIWRVFYPKS